MWTIFRAEVKRYFRVQWSNPGDSISWLLYTLLVFIAAIVILNGVSGGGYGREEQLLVLVGWLTWVVASDCMNELPYAISEETRTGTLEQVCLAPISLAGILTLRSLAYLLGVGAKGILAVVLLALFVAPLPAGPMLVILFLISLIGAYGLGFLFAGVALVFKRTEALVGLVFSLMIFLTGALVGLEVLGWIYQVLKFALPLTWGISLMRETLSEGENLMSLWRSGQLAGLSLHSAAYLVLGLTVFTIGFWRARAKGTLAHY
jgi:ABC-2 type transport system permease protein